jgi:hypothetical protein
LLATRGLSVSVAGAGDAIGSFRGIWAIAGAVGGEASCSGLLSDWVGGVLTVELTVPSLTTTLDVDELTAVVSAPTLTAETDVDELTAVVTTAALEVA